MCAGFSIKKICEQLITPVLNDQVGVENFKSYFMRIPIPHHIHHMLNIY